MAAVPGIRTPRPYQVAWTRKETADTVTLGLTPVLGERMTYEAGQFNMLYAFGVGEVPISISGDPLEGGTLWHTIRDVGSVSHALCAMTAGETVGVRGPFGRGWGVASVPHDLVIVAGGIGLAPLRSVITGVIAERSRFAAVHVIIGARTAEDLPFRAEIERWRTDGQLDVHVTVDRATPGWSGTVGVVTRVLPRVDIRPDATAMVCGPEVMMRLTAQALVDRGMDPGNIRLSMERTMQCAFKRCGHCQLSPFFICADGPVLTWQQLEPVLAVREL